MFWNKTNGKVSNLDNITLKVTFWKHLYSSLISGH